MVNTKEIKKRMIDYNQTYKSLADGIGVTPTTMRQKINNKRDIKLAEAVQLKRLLNVDNDDFVSVFMTNES